MPDMPVPGGASAHEFTTLYPQTRARNQEQNTGSISGRPDQARIFCRRKQLFVRKLVCHNSSFMVKSLSSAAVRIGYLQKTSLIEYPGRISAVVFTQGCNFR